MLIRNSSSGTRVGKQRVLVMTTVVAQDARTFPRLRWTTSASSRHHPHVSTPVMRNVRSSRWPCAFAVVKASALPLT